MQNESSILDIFYQGWREYQQKLGQAIAPLSEADLARQAAPNLRPIGRIALHIVGARVRWLRGIGEGSEDVDPLGRWDRSDAPMRPAVELVSGLERSARLVYDSVAHWTPEFMSAPTLEEEEDGQVWRYSRAWVIWRLIEHDLHHGGEISLTLGMFGLKAPDL